MKSIEVLQKAYEHIHYEVDMFYKTSKLFNESNQHPLITNILIESITMRTRILIHFFFPTKPREDDILAEDFFDESGEWEKIRGLMPEELSEVGKRVGKRNCTSYICPIEY